MKITKIALKHLIKEEVKNQKQLLQEQYNNVPDTSPTCGGFPIVQTEYDGLPNFKLPMGGQDLASYQIPLGNFAFQYHLQPPATLENTTDQYILEPCTWGQGELAIVYFKNINYVLGNMTNAAGMLGNPIFPEGGVSMAWVQGGGDSEAANYEFQTANLNTTVYDVALPSLDDPNVTINGAVFGDQSLDTPPYQHIVGELEYCLCEVENPNWEGLDLQGGDGTKPTLNTFGQNVSSIYDSPNYIDPNDVIAITPGEPGFCSDFDGPNPGGALITYQLHPTNLWTQPYAGDPEGYPLGSMQGGWYMNPCNPYNYSYFFKPTGEWHDSCAWQELLNYETIGGNPGPCWGGLPYMYFGNAELEGGNNYYISMMCGYGSCYYKDEYPGGFLDFCCQSNLEAGDYNTFRPEEDPELIPLWGCTDPDAYNYSNAEQDDGSCEYPPDPSNVFHYNLSEFSCINPSCELLNSIQNSNDCEIGTDYPYEIYEDVPPTSTVLQEEDLFVTVQECCASWFAELANTIYSYYIANNWNWFQEGGYDELTQYNSGNCPEFTGELDYMTVLGFDPDWFEKQQYIKDPQKQILQKRAGIKPPIEKIPKKPQK